MADEEFRVTGLSPSYAFLVKLVNDHPGINQKTVCEILQLAPSTITRFVDKLVQKGFTKRQSEGKTILLFPTKKAQTSLPKIMKAWKRLYERYSQILGKENGGQLTRQIDRANMQLEQEEDTPTP
jgi:DNA-binding MarR family transcriptional regulator